MSEDTEARNRDWRIRENEQHRNAVCDWLTANGIDIKRVPIDAKASVADGMLTIPLNVQDEHGRDQIDPNDPLRVMRHTVTVPLKVPPTYHVELWLTPTCAACGR